MGNQTGKNIQFDKKAKPKKFVHWKSAERPSPPGKPIPLRVSNTIIDAVSLKWDISSNDGGSPIIGYIIEHRKVGSSNWISIFREIVPKAEVTISGLEPGWRYQFRIIAVNAIGKSDPGEVSDPVRIFLHRNIIPPKFVKELNDIITVENERVEMKVIVTGQPPPEINWFKDGYEIFSTRRTKILYDNDVSIFIIHQCAIIDAGEIKCTATNLAGHAVSKAFLKVVAPPKIRLPKQYEDGLIVESGETVILKTGVSGHPFPIVNWYHDGKKINNSSAFEITTNEKSSILKIRNIRRLDRGEYIVSASNNFGEDLVTFLVTVTSKPTPPGKVEFSMTFGRSVTLKWTAPEDDGGCKIGNYIIEYFRIGWNVWLKATTTRQLTATLHDLIEGSKYKFRVKVENPYGVSDPSPESNVILIPDQKNSKIKQNQQLSTTKNLAISPKTTVLLSAENLLNQRPNPGKPLIIDRKSDEMLHNSFAKSKNIENLNQNIQQSKLTKLSEGTQSLGLQKIRASPTQNNDRKTNDYLFSEVESQMKPNDKNFISPWRKLSLPMEFEKIADLTPEQKTNSFSEKIYNFLLGGSFPERKDFQVNLSKSEGLINVPKRRDSIILSKYQNKMKKTNIGSTRRDCHEDEKIFELSNTKIAQCEDSINSSTKMPEPYEILTQDKNQLYSKQNENDYELATRNNSSLDIEKDNSGTFIDNKIKTQITDENSLAVQHSRNNQSENDLHSSHEVMLILQPFGESNSTEKIETFDLDLQEALSPPKISFSVPDMTSNYLDFKMFPIRRSASSTEILYEKALSRFHEAVKLEKVVESQKRKLSEKINQDTIQNEEEDMKLDRNSNLELQDSECSSDYSESTQASSETSKEKFDIITPDTYTLDRTGTSLMVSNDDVSSVTNLGINNKDSSNNNDLVIQKMKTHDNNFENKKKIEFHITQPALEKVETKKPESSQSNNKQNIEEANVIIRHYNDIIQESSYSRNLGVKWYMRKQENNSELEDEDNEDYKRNIPSNKDKSTIDTTSIPVTSTTEYSPQQDRDDLSKSSSKQSKEEKILDKNLQSMNNDPCSNLSNIKNKRKKKISKKVVPRPVKSSSRSNESKLPKAEIMNNTEHVTENKLKGPVDTVEDETEKAVHTAHMTFSYLTDLGLMIFACWIYIFKDVRFVLPILALLLYRQIKTAISQQFSKFSIFKSKT